MISTLTILNFAAPLSGRQVFAEALGRKKGSGKPHKSKDHVEKDQYMFKRREEAVESKTHKISPSSESDVSALPVKSTHASVLGPVSQPSLSGMGVDIEQSVTQPVAVIAFHGEEQVYNNVSGSHPCMVIDTKPPVVEGSKTHPGNGVKKGKLHKRPPGEMNSESSVAVEKKKKKRKKDSTRQSFDQTEVVTAAGKEGALPRKVGEKSLQIGAVPRENSLVNHQENDDKAITPSLPYSVGTKPAVGDKGIQHEFPQLLDDLRALALNPFHGTERSCQAIVRDVFLRFRCIVYQKSLNSLAPSENESKEARPSLSSLYPSSDSPPNENLKDVPSAKPAKPLKRQEDPTKAGRKRGPSDRQEEMVAKKKKKINDLKILAAEKKTNQKTPEGQRGHGKETTGKVMGQMPERKTVQRTSEVQRGDAREMAGKPMALAPSRVSGSESTKKRQLPVRAANPTMLVMKFPPAAALPSSAELKAKFARFGPLDHSGTRIFWKSSTCRLVYQYKIDAHAALKFATSSTNLFGNTNVRCHLREIGLETTETESSAKVQKEEPPYNAYSQSRESPALQHRMTSVPQPLQQPSQLKSCLKKPSSEDGNGSVSRGRVKFMLGGEGSSKTNGDDGASSHHAHGLNYNTEKIHMAISQPSSSSSSILPVPQFPKASNNYHHHQQQQSEIVSRNVVQKNSSTPSSSSSSAALPISGPTNIDITHQMLSLLTRCKDVVNNLTGTLGYVPYHPL